MKKNSRLKSFFAILLAVSMIFQQSSLTVLATDDTYVEDATATPTPSESEAEAYTTEGAEPVAEKQEEPQQMQETPAAEQAQEPTEAPAEQPTEAPAEQPTEAPAEQPTEAPATEPTAAPAAEVTEAPAAPEATATPAAEATATPTPEVSALPSETPMPTITPTPELTNQFQSNSGNVSATVLLQDDKLEINSTSFLIEEKDLDSEYVSELVDPAMNVWCESNGMTIIDAAVFDMHFNDNDGKEISNIESAVVNVGFANPILGSVAGNVYVLHIKDGVAFDVTGNVAQNSDGTVSGAVINTNGFSPFVLVKVTKENSVELTAEPSTKLNDFVTTVEIANGKYDANGKLILYPGSDFSFKLSFAETEGKQMNVEKNLEYEYPLALTPTGQNGTFEIVAKKGSDTYVVRGNTYEIIGNKIIFKLNKSDPNFQQIRDASNVSFDIDLKAKVNDDATGDKINFGDSVEKDVTFEENGVVNVVKTGTYDKAKGKFWYEVTVSATGTCKNVVVTDAITGTLLTYDDNLTANPVKDGVTEITNSNGFSYTIPRMIDGETIKLKYSASIDYAKLGKNDKEFTVDQTKNTVTAKVDNTPSGSDEKDFEHTTIAGSMSKSAIDNNTAGNKQTTTWKIVINPDANQYVGGSKVTDTLQQNANAKTEYSGTGLVVKIYDKQGNLIETKTPAWGDSDLQWNKENHWQYTLPTNGNGTPYKYEIEYTTETDVSQILDNVTIVNNAEDGNGGSVSGSTTATVTPGNKFEVGKSHANATENGVDWTVSIDIPERGFNQSFVVTDTLPGTWNGEWCSDQFIRESLKIELGNVRLVENRDYTLDYTANVRGARNQFKVTFINVNTLFPAGVDGRVLTLSYKTKPDTNWPEGEEHRNDVTVVGDGKNKNVSDSYKIVKHKLSKEATKNSKIEWENGLPCFKFDILLEGVDQDPTYIEDIFDKTLFKVNDDTTNVYLKAQLGAGDYSWDAQNAANGSSNGGDVSWTTTENGVQFKISNLAKKGEAYYSYYCIRYTLKVIDANALKKLEQLAASSEDHKYAIENTAKWDNSDSDNSYKYEIKPITKTVVEPSEGNNFVATFTIIVNPNKVKLNNGNPIRLDDHLTVSGNGKMKILPDTIDVQLDPTGGTYKKDYSEDRESFTLEIPDECKATITYQAKAYGNKGSTITYSNDATIIGGYDASVDNKNITITSSASGTSEVFMYKIVKRDAVTKERLEAAKFQLYEVTETGEKELYDKSKNNAPVTFTTDSNGVAVIEGKDETVYGWHLYEGRTYRLKEIEAPEGYEKAAPITFTVLSSNDQNTEVGKYGLFNGEDIDVYDLKAVEVNLDAKKTLKGENLTANEFNFKLEPDESNKNDKNSEQNKKNDGNGKITFDKLTFSKAGTYKYTITEVSGNDGTITYDGAVYEVVITVSENENGGLIVNKTINKKTGNEVQNNVSEITFENTYIEPSPAEYQFGVEKVLAGITNTETEYTFELKEGGNTLDTVKVKGKGSKTFKKLIYNAEGTHIYTVKETSIAPAEDAHGSWVYDNSEHEVKVTVRYDAASNKYEVESVTGLDEKKNVGITNSYTEKAPSPTKYQFGVEKLIAGTTGTNTEYTFELREGKDLVDTVSVTGTGSKKFRELTYDEAGTHIYTVKETSTAPEADAHGSWVYDNSEHEVKVTVRYDAVANAYVVENVTGLDTVQNVEITNQFISSVAIDITAQKSMKVSSESLGTFEFELSGDNIETQTVTNNEAGAITFAPIHYNLSDVGNTYTYTVREKAPSTEAQYKTDGIKYVYDTTVYTVKVKVEDNGDGTLKLTKTVKIGEKDYTDPEMRFVNDTTKATITKVDALGNQLSGVELEVRDKNNEVVDSWTTSTKENPHVITGKLILGETYKLVEKSAPAGYTLADPVEFTVSENDIDNKVEMKNIYSASGSLNLTAEKTLTTTETPLAADQFTFELRDKDGTVLQTKTNDADGNVTFDEIKYNLVKDAAYKDNTDKKVDDIGEYQYTVNEVKGDAVGYTYDDTVYTINVTVTDAGNGTLTVTPVIHSSKATSEDATVTGMEFINTYTTSGQIVLGATKTLDGQTLEAEQFSFQATEMDADGNAVENGYNETVKNADGGAITFPIITYKESGTHYYQITEVKDEKPAYQYDESKYVVKVDVTDDNAGKLTAKVTSVTKNGEPVKSEDLTGAVTFTNTYSASADLELKAQKSMKVEAEQLGTFEFELKDTDGKVIETVKNDEKGAISFSKLSYTEKDAGKTFTYTVNEKLPSEADTYVYDKTVYTVTVNVEDNRDGTLKLTTKVNGEDYTETAMKFVNDTTKVTISKVDDTTLKALAGAKLQVVDDQDKVVEEWTSDGTPHVITAKLVLGKTYKLVEAEAPSGYEIAEPITFTVDADDTKNAVEMKDAMTKGKTAAIEITKELKLNDALAGAKDMTFYAALFADAECTIPASDVKALEFKNASSSTVTFTNLDLGRTYYVSETDVTGKAIDSGMTPDEKVYVPVYPQGQAITVTEDGAKSSITFENQFSEWPDGFYKIATLNVTKKLLGADGNALESDEIFYAGIFDDKECTTLSTRTEKNILTLDLAGGSTVSESTQAVVIPDEAFTLYVAETDAEGNLVDGTDGFRYAVTVENGNVLFDENNLNAEVTIINQKQPEATPTVTPEETITPTPTPGTSTGVKTGDDTPIGFYMALFFVAALAIEETTRRRRKKEQD